MDILFMSYEHSQQYDMIHGCLRIEGQYQDWKHECIVCYAVQVVSKQFEIKNEWQKIIDPKINAVELQAMAEKQWMYTISHDVCTIIKRQPEWLIKKVPLTFFFQLKLSA